MRKIVLEADGTVDPVLTPERLDAHKLIEEFMILATSRREKEALEKATDPVWSTARTDP